MDTIQYRSGKIHMECACGWEGDDYGKEYSRCPRCGKSFYTVTLMFGGLHITYRSVANRFDLEHPNTNARISLSEADLPATIQFLEKHFRPW